MTPTECPSVSISGAHIKDRMRKSAILWAKSKRSSDEASVEMTACLCSRTCRTIVRLMRIVPSSSSRRLNFIAKGFKFPFASAITMKPRSTCLKRSNKQSSTFGNTLSKAIAEPSALVISIKALSLASGLATSCLK